MGTSSSAASSTCRWPSWIPHDDVDGAGLVRQGDWNAEEGWTLMPNGTLLTVDVLNNPNSEHYIPSEQRWVSDGNTIANLQGPPEVGCINYGGGQYCPPGETGNGVLRPDGSVFATGALHSGARAGHTSIYRPAPPRMIPARGHRDPTSRMATTRATTSRCC